MFKEKFTKYKTNWEKTNTCKKQIWEHAWRRFENPIGLREELSVLVRSGVSLKSSRMRDKSRDCIVIFLLYSKKFY